MPATHEQQSTIPSPAWAKTRILTGSPGAQNCRLGGRRRALAGQQACTRMKGPGAQSAISYWRTERSLTRYSTRCPCAQRTTQSLTSLDPSSRGFRQRSKQLFRYQIHLAWPCSVRSLSMLKISSRRYASCKEIVFPRQLCKMRPAHQYIFCMSRSIQEVLKCYAALMCCLCMYTEGCWVPTWHGLYC